MTLDHNRSNKAITALAFSQAQNYFNRFPLLTFLSIADKLLDEWSKHHDPG